MFNLSKTQILKNNLKKTTEYALKAQNHNQMPSLFSFSYKTYKNSEVKDNSELNYEYNKYNAPNILFDKQTSKEIEKSFGKVIERSKINEEAKKLSSSEVCKIKQIYYTSCDYIPKVYIEGQNENEVDKNRNGNYNNYDN